MKKVKVIIINQKEKNKVYISDESDKKPRLYITVKEIAGGPYNELACSIGIEESKRFEEPFLFDYHNMEDRWKVISRQIHSRIHDCIINNRLIQAVGISLIGISIFRKKICICNVGNLKVYRYRNEELEIITTAHTDEKLIQQMNLIRRPHIICYLGMEDNEIQIEPEIITEKIIKNDIYIIDNQSNLSEGNLSDDRITEIIRYINSGMPIFCKKNLTERKG